MAIGDSWAHDTEVVNNVLSQEANRIGSDVHKNILHTSPWIDLVKKSTFPDGMGAQLTSLIYDRALPTYDDAGQNLLENNDWVDMTNLNATANAFNTSNIQGQQNLKDGGNTNPAEGTGGDGAGKGFISVSKRLHNYEIQKVALESPRISIEDLRFAAHRAEQLRAVVDLLSSSAKHVWEDRYRMEFDRLAGNFVPCLTASTSIYGVIDKSLYAASASTGLKFKTNTVSIDLNNDFETADADVDKTPSANISNAILDKIYFANVRKGAGNNAYGRENGRPIFGLVCSSEASYQLQTEAGFRDDVRYNSAVVSDLIAPLGVEKGFRGYYHLIDDLAPRFSATGGALTAISPYTMTAGVSSMNSAYDTADYEAAYAIHPEVYEALIPKPFSAGSGVSFDPVTYTGDFKWTNILSSTTNPDGAIGYFRGILASASKPIKHDFGYVVLFKRNSTTPAA